MAISTSFGYAGTVNAPQWAQLLPYAGGNRYGVRGYGDWRPTVGGPGDRALTIGEGYGWGHGVFDYNDAPVVKNLAPVSSGSRWDLVVARRVWGTKVTSFEVVEGSSAQNIPSRLDTPGTSDEQPIALARVQAGSANIVELIDLRCIPGDSGLMAFDELALQYLNRPATRVRIGTTDWIRTIDNLGSGVWVVASTVEQKNLGANIAGVNIAGNGMLATPLIKTGRITDFGTAQFGNQYLTAVRFETPFPTALLSVQVTALHADGAVVAQFAIDFADRTGFRALVPGSGANVKRAALWTAWGI